MNNNLNEISPVIEVKRNLSVPAPDLQSALTAIDNVIFEKQRSLRKRNPNSLESCNEKIQIDESTTGSSIHISKVEDHNKEVLLDAIDQLHKSFSNNLKRFTNPVSTEEFEEALRKHQNTDRSSSSSGRKAHSYLDLLEEDTINSDDSDESSVNTADHIETSSDEEDYEDNELFIDKEAQARVIKLRAKVREEARSLHKLQTELPQLASDLAKKEIDLFSEQMKSVPLGESIGHLDSVDEKENTEYENDDKNVEVMQSSFKKLTSTLQSIQNTMPENLEGLQETINTIEESIQRRLNMNQNNSKMSAIERAIYSVNDIDHRHDSNKSQANENDSDFLNAEKRLSLFLAK